jgi:stage III sporulation protein SpoIIIAA
MSPEVIIIDEIGSESEALSLSRSARLGVPIIASVHADGIEGIIANKPVFSLVEAGAFKTLFRVFKNGAGKFQMCEVEAEKCLNT